MFKLDMRNSMTAATAAALLAGSATVVAEDGPSVTVGAGMRASYSATEDAAGNGSDYDNNFTINSARLYITGQVNDTIKMTFNSFCESCLGFNGTGTEPRSQGDWEILDVIAQFEFNDAFNVWAGRMLTPADRIEMNGPYYGINWFQYNVPLLPSDGGGTAGLLGRDDGVTVFGKLDFFGENKFEYAVGVFDGVDFRTNQGAASAATNPEDNVLIASRFEYNFLNVEPVPNYYTASTYLGGVGDIATLGFSVTHQSEFYDNLAGTTNGDFTAYIVDGLYEKVLGNGGVFNLEGEYKTFDTDDNNDVDSYFVTGAYLFPQKFALGGQFQPYVRWVDNQHDSTNVAGNTVDTDLIEVGVNYRIESYNAYLNFNYNHGDAGVNGNQRSVGDTDQFLVGVQLQI